VKVTVTEHERALLGGLATTGDPLDVIPRAVELVTSALMRGEGVTVVVSDTLLAPCGKCGARRPVTEPRRRQPTRVSRGYYACTVCGYVIEGIVP